MLLIEFLFDKANPVNMSSDSLSESVNRSSDMTPELSLTILPSITRIFFFGSTSSLFIFSSVLSPLDTASSDFSSCKTDLLVSDPDSSFSIEILFSFWISLDVSFSLTILSSTFNRSLTADAIFSFSPISVSWLSSAHGQTMSLFISLIWMVELFSSSSVVEKWTSFPRLFSVIILTESLPIFWASSTNFCINSLASSL